MRFSLNGSDWQANYFLPEQHFQRTKMGYCIDGMLMDSCRSAGVCWGDKPEDMLNATIPGCDRTILLENGEIDDPYYGRNAERSLWSEDAEWCFRKDFVLPAEWAQNRRSELVFHSAGYQAAIFFNNEYLGRYTGMLTQWRMDVTGFVKPGENNTLVMIFEPAPKASPNHSSFQDAEFAKFHHVQMSFGWDWARRLVPTGIFDDVELIGTDTLRIKDAYFSTSKNKATVQIELGALEDCEKSLKLDLCALNHDGKGYTAEFKVKGIAGETTYAEHTFELDDVRYWFPNGYGDQNLYKLTLTLPGDEFTCQVGYRDLKMVRNLNSFEEAYPLTFEINGKRIFARGVNWVPIDMMFSRIDDAAYERQIRLAKVGNFNLFRVWGGGLIEKRAFFDACDRHGILVWQEFAHACSSYPADNKYIAMKKREAVNALRKTRNHCSMAMYCGGNEFQYYGEIPDSPLYTMYEKTVNEMAPGMPYHVSSPDLSRPGERSHGPWCFLEHSFWNTHHRLLASELGCNGWSELESIDRFIPQNSPCPDGQAWRYHFTYNHSSRPLKPMTDMFAPEKGNRRHYSQCTMACQADQLSYVMAHYRNKFPVSSGCYIWQYNESFPTNSFSIIDFYSMPKAAYYAVARSNEPVILFAEDESWRLNDNIVKSKLYCVSDEAELENAEAIFTMLDLYGNTLVEKRFTANIKVGSNLIGEIDTKFDAAPAEGVVIGRLTLLDSNKNKVFYNERLYGAPDLTRALHLEKVALEVKKSITEVNGETVLKVMVSNPGKLAAVNVRARLADVDFNKVFWQHNYMHIMPGETVTFTADVTEKFTEAPAVEIYGWNHTEKVF